MTTLRGPLTVAAIHILSRIWAVHRGVTFDVTGLAWHWQLLDPELLRHRLLESVLYLHTQPPLYNLAVGVLLKLSSHPEVLGQWVFWALGLGMHLGLYALGRALGLPRVVAVLAAALSALDPATLLYESVLFYTHPAAVLCVLAALALHRAMSRDRLLDWLLFLGLVADLTWTLSFFHPLWGALWMLAGAGLLWRRGHRRWLAAPLVCLVFIALPTVRNGLLFHAWTPSTQSGMNLARVAVGAVPLPLRRALVSAGTVSPVALVMPFSPLEDYPEALTALEHPHPEPAVSAVMKSTGTANLNHESYIAVARAYSDASRTLVRSHPQGYLRKVGRAWLIFFIPATEYFAVLPNRMKIAGYVDFFNTWVVGMPNVHFPVAFNPGNYAPSTLLEGVGFRGALAFLLALGAAAVRIAQFRRRAEAASTVTLVFVVTTALYVAVVGNLLECGENNRFRFMVEPLLTVLFVDFVHRALRALRTRRVRAQ